MGRRVCGSVSLISLLCLFSLIPTIHSLLELLLVSPGVATFPLLFLVLLPVALRSYRVFFMYTIHLQSKFLFEVPHQLLLGCDGVVLSEADTPRIVARLEKLRPSLSKKLETIYFR